jgi:guanylate kinase
LAEPAVKRPRLIVVSGPSGVGKTTLCEALLRDPRLTASVSCTTRAPRAGETDGRDYVFLSRPEFERRIAAGAFLEHAEVHGQRYGTPREPVEAALRAGMCPLLDIDVQGADQVRAKGLPSAFLFIAPRDLEVLRERLKRRRTESEAEMTRRLETAARELEAAPRYDRVFVNDDLDATVRAMRAYLEESVFRQ